MSTRLRTSASVRQFETSEVYDTYWRFAALRQEIFHRRVLGESWPWSSDEVLAQHRFTNAYRASDRVSQYLIRHVAYAGDQTPDEVFFRVVLFKLFNRVSTWQLLTKVLGSLTVSSFDIELYDSILTTSFEAGDRIYSAAYIMPPASPGALRKHRTHLDLLQKMLSSNLPQAVAEATSMRDAFALLRNFRGIGDFLAYQLVTDLNYSELTNFSEMDFVSAGPGARSGIRKCFLDTNGFNDEDIIRYVADQQDVEFAKRGLHFDGLWGRPLQLIDCQNLFCEVDKYARVAHPRAQGIGERTRIKQRFRPSIEPLDVWFPPKWGLNDRLPATTSALSSWTPDPPISDLAAAD